jgi:hypothetical protein
MDISTLQHVHMVMMDWIRVVSWLPYQSLFPSSEGDLMNQWNKNFLNFAQLCHEIDNFDRETAVYVRLQ